MSESSKYWKLVRLDAAEASGGYKLQLLPSAKVFFQTQIAPLGEEQGAIDPITDLFDLQTAPTTDWKLARLCLRCYISYPILQSCYKRARLFGTGNGFTYRDLLPFVLNDDGTVEPAPFTPFAIEILNSYSTAHQCSLSYWADLRVRRNPELNQFLLEHGLRLSSDWALLNRAKLKDLEGIDRPLVEVFHQVYRRDRPQQHRQGMRQKCSDPTERQLQDMLTVLRDRQVLLHSTNSLLAQLRRIAQNLRQQSIWGGRGFPLAEPLETTDPETGEVSFKEIPDQQYISDPEKSERLELQAFCYQQLLACLDHGIRTALSDRIQQLQQRPHYAQFAPQLIPALRLFYFEGKSQGQIANILGMSNQSQVSRILNPKELLNSIRQHTIEALLQQILAKVRELKIAEWPLTPDYLNHLMQQLDAFVDEQVFQPAFAEMNVSRGRSMASLYAEHLKRILTEQELSPAA